MANAPAFRLERGEGSAYRVLGARADAAAARKAQPAARVEQQSDGNEREHAGKRERAGGQSDDRHTHRPRSPRRRWQPLGAAGGAADGAGSSIGSRGEGRTAGG